MAAMEDRDMEDKDLLMIGRIIRSHGVQGELKVLPETDDPNRLLELSNVYVGEDEASSVLLDVESSRLQQSKKGLIVLMAFKGVVGRDAADALRNQLVFATRDELPPLEDGEFFLHELVGCKVDTAEGEVIGTIKEVLELPAQNVYVVKRSGKKDVMIPAVPAFIETIDVDAKQVVIRPIEGLLDD